MAQQKMNAEENIAGEKKLFPFPLLVGTNKFSLTLSTGQGSASGYKISLFFIKQSTDG